MRSIVIERLETAGLLDDTDFAGYWTANRGQFSPRGDRALRRELSQKGVARDISDAAIDQLPDEESRAQQAGRRKLRSISSLDEMRFKRQMSSFLARRGFSFQTAREVTDSLWQEAQRG